MPWRRRDLWSSAPDVVQVHLVEAVIVALGLSLAFSRTAAAGEHDSKGKETLASCRPDIAIAATVDERGRVEASVHEAICKTLREHDIDLDELPDGRALVIEVSGVEYERNVSVGVVQDGIRVSGSPQAAPCHCSDQTMLAEISRATVAVVPLLQSNAAPTGQSGGTPRGQSNVAPTGQSSRTPTSKPVSGDTPPAKAPSNASAAPPLGGMGRAGLSLIAASAAGTFIGITFIVSGARVDRPSAREGSALRPVGYGLLGASLALGITGAVLLGVDRRRAKRMQTVAPIIAPGLVGVAVQGRF